MSASRPEGGTPLHTTLHHPAVLLRRGGKWTIAILVSFDDDSESSNKDSKKAGSTDAAKAVSHLMTHSVEMAQADVPRRRHWEVAMARHCHRHGWRRGAGSEQDRARAQGMASQGMAPEWTRLELPRVVGHGGVGRHHGEQRAHETDFAHQRQHRRCGAARPRQHRRWPRSSRRRRPAGANGATTRTVWNQRHGPWSSWA